MQIWRGVPVEYKVCIDFLSVDFLWPVCAELIVCMACARKVLEQTSCKQGINNLVYFC